MKIIHSANYGGGNRELSIGEAVEHAATADAYSYSGQLEKLASENERLRGIVGRLVEAAFNDEYSDKKKALSYILGFGYEVEE